MSSASKSAKRQLAEAAETAEVKSAIAKVMARAHINCISPMPGILHAGPRLGAGQRLSHLEQLDRNVVR